MPGKIFILINCPFFLKEDGAVDLKATRRGGFFVDEASWWSLVTTASASSVHLVPDGS